MRVAFHPTASEEIIETTAYYEDVVPGLGESFIAEVERISEVLCDQPRIGQSVGEELRRILLARFPYSLIYSKEPERIWVIAVAHHRRRPGYWQERTDR